MCWLNLIGGVFMVKWSLENNFLGYLNNLTMNTEYKCLLFSQFKLWLNTQASYAITTKNPYLRISQSFLNYLDNFSVATLKDVDKEILFKFLSKRGDKEYSKAYIRLRESALDLFFAWANEQRFCQNNPVIEHRKANLHLKPFPKKCAKTSSLPITVLSGEEQQQLLDSITETIGSNKNFTAIRNKCIVILILETALYAEELINLLVDGVDLENNYINVANRENKERCIPISLKLHQVCKEWLTIRAALPLNDKQSTFFLTEDSNPITKRHLYKIISSAMQGAGINKEHLGSEILRQTAICNMFRSGLSLEKVQKITGITTLANLKKYLDYKLELTP